jgi:hypothetical protein
VAHESLAQDHVAAVGQQTCAADAAEVLCAPDHLAGAAVRALGWEGVVLPPAAALGRRVVVVAELLTDVHEQRIAAGWPPVTDRTSVSTWHWPEMERLVPQSAVRLSGVLAPARHWRTGLAGTAPFVGLCPTALLLPSDVARDGECLSYAARYGPTVVAAAGPHDLDQDAVDVVQPGQRNAMPSAQPNAVGRWVHELVYDRLVKHYAAAA